LSVVIWFTNSKNENQVSKPNVLNSPKSKKIWQLLKTKEEENINLAQQLTKGQGWTDEIFEVYKNCI